MAGTSSNVAIPASGTWTLVAGPLVNVSLRLMVGELCQRYYGAAASPPVSATQGASFTRMDDPSYTVKAGDSVWVRSLSGNAALVNVAQQDG